MGSDELVEQARQCPDIAHARIVAPGDRVPEVVMPTALRDALIDHIEALTAQLAEARESERAAMTEVNGLKDALAQVPEFICRKCGRRQDGPTDNEARF